MTKKITYVAYNGMEFEDENECKEYEQYAVDMATQLMKCYSFFDKNGEYLTTTPAAFNRLEDFCEWFEDTYNDCEYIVKIKDCPASAVTWAKNEFGSYIPEEENGIYSFDFKNGKWCLELTMA